MEKRTCTTCKQEKFLEDFSPRKNGKYGKRSVCKDCLCKVVKTKYHKDPDKYIEAARQYRKENSNSKLAVKKYKDKHPERKLLDGAKYRAKKKGIECNLTKDDIIVPEFCPILGIKLEFSKSCVSDNSPSLDRVDCTKGYIKGNVQVISHKANRLKGHCTLDELRKILNYLENEI